MTSWTERAKAAIAHRGTDKTDESGSPKLLTVSSAAPTIIPIREISNSSVLAVSFPEEIKKNESNFSQMEDPDRWCWPNSSAMNGREIDIFLIRVERFRSLGLDTNSAEKVADRLVIRDRDMDDRTLCFECCHLRNGWRCMNLRNAGEWVQYSNSKLHDDFVHLFQRCPGFKLTIGDAIEPRQ
jgi:hypothetical protein